ncbi:hypothetical protein D3C81_963010 [compost metagenome]
MQRVRAVNWSCTAFNIVYKAILISNDECTLKLTHIFRVDTEVSLQRNFTFYTLRYINEATTRPYRTVKSSEFVIRWRNDRSEVLPENFRMLTKGTICIHKNNALCFKILLHAVIYYFGFILCGYARKELLFRFRNTQLIKCFLNFCRNLFPGLTLFLGRSYIVLNVVKIKLIEITAPTWHWHFLELLQRFQPEVKHPFRFIFDTGNFSNDFAGQTFTRLENRLVLIPEAIFIIFHFRRFFCHGCITSS